MRRQPPGSAGVPPAPGPHSYAYPSNVDQPQTAPFPDHCVRDVPGLHPIITPPLEGESDVVRRQPPGSADVPPALGRHSYAYLPHVDQPQTAPLPDHCVKDVPGLYPLITPPLRGSRRSRAARRRLMRWGVEANPPAPRGHAGSLQHRPDLLKTCVRHSPLSVHLEQDRTYTGFNSSQ